MTMDPERFRFGTFEFDAAKTELRRDGILVHFQSQPAKVLKLLVGQAGQIISRDHLRAAIWGEETFVDFERGLNVCIAQIRSVLGDESTSPRFIRTVPRRGYQFIHPVERIAVPAMTERTERHESRTFPWRIFVAFLAAVVILIVAVALQFRCTGESDSPVIVAVTPFDNETGDPGINSFCNDLTDTLVQQLTASGQDGYQVIGNASVLRVPRDQRNLVKIAESLHANYVIVGQVQGGGSKTRILAHLIHMPEQTHVWVVRLEQPFEDPYALESSAARGIAAEFSVKLTDPALRAKLRSASTH
jgi:DNA-binding winged helix-turn-helix (wHTH) protein/TolB-like protein